MIGIAILNYDNTKINDCIEAIKSCYGTSLIKSSEDYPVMEISEPLSSSEVVLNDIIAIFNNKEVHALMVNEKDEIIKSTFQ